MIKDDEAVPIFKGTLTALPGSKTGKKSFAHDTTLYNTLGLLAQLPLTSNQLFLSRLRSLPTESAGLR